MGAVSVRARALPVIWLAGAERQAARRPMIKSKTLIKQHGILQGAGRPKIWQRAALQIRMQGVLIKKLKGSHAARGTTKLQAAPANSREKRSRCRRFFKRW